MQQPKDWYKLPTQTTSTPTSSRAHPIMQVTAKTWRSATTQRKKLKLISKAHFAETHRTSHKACIPLQARYYESFARKYFSCVAQSRLHVLSGICFVCKPRPYNPFHAPIILLEGLQRNTTGLRERCQKRRVLDWWPCWYRIFFCRLCSDIFW